ncbi:helix-turn-helix domain-containing protein [Streptomyces dubilierae]|uniref:Helix-turn-helix transcriptional regulator n=1 Tax=Streptomyces dubilierae TaxID=3075533 RepID=A0ABU2P6W0_9ACTN|nr:helix-turn-helix transcriptional regulator [Streptomyces sp. DSM 41921]MDT0387881.1 helix-turn-helix transcriptional regulator [Streptomyces sp. DSM 41921]
MTTPVPKPEPLFEVDRDLLKRLMKRTKTGSEMSIRDLAEAAGIAHGTVGNILSGETSKVYASTAEAISHAIGVELLVLCTPVYRLSVVRQRALTA